LARKYHPKYKKTTKLVIIFKQKKSFVFINLQDVLITIPNKKNEVQSP